MVCQKESHILPVKCDAFPAKCDAFPAKYVMPSGKPLALGILNNFKLSHYQKRVEKTKNTTKISEFDLICRKNLVFGVRVPLKDLFLYIFKNLNFLISI